MADRSIVEYFREHEGYRCGYCGQKDSNYSHGMWAHQMTCEDYQDLIDRGWRRSGKYCYKPDMKKQCCPSYTIRCAALNFNPSKSQKKVMKKMNKYLTVTPKDSDPVDGEKTRTAEHEAGEEIMVASEHPDVAHQKCLERIKLHNAVEEVRVVTDVVDGTDDTSTVVQTRKDSGDNQTTSDDKLQPDSAVVVSSKQKAAKTFPAKGSGPDPNKPQCKKAKELRHERREKKLLKQQRDTQVEGSKVQKQRGPVVKSLEEFLIDRIPGQTPVHRLEVKFVRSDPDIEEFQQTFPLSAALFFKYQRAVHNDPPEKCTERRIKLVRSDKLAESRESFKQTHSVYQKYQMAIHKDPPSECDELQFQRFLVDSPLMYRQGPGIPTEGFGSFHQQYYIDGKLIAVGVLDILPKCVSSVYFYYDPEFSFLSLGTYSALREIQLTRELHRQCSSLDHYYMGFYIHSCPKMKYKGQYEGSELLCPETFRWFSITICRPKLDASKYSRLDDSLDNDPPGVNAIQSVLVLFNRQILPYQLYQHIAQAEDEEEVNEYAELVGSVVASRMLLFRSR